jgi:hypothetical protein
MSELPRAVVAMIVVGATVACARTDRSNARDSSVAARVDSATPPRSVPAASVVRRTEYPVQTPPTPVVSPSETVLTGKVVAGGVASNPVTSLQVDGGKPTTLVGPLEPELRRLGGAYVWLTGEPVPNAGFNVGRYEIVSIDGAKPVVGQVVVRNGTTWLLTDRDTVKVNAAPPQLAQTVGAKVWVVGRRAANELVPQSFGIIRAPD